MPPLWPPLSPPLPGSMHNCLTGEQLQAQCYTGLEACRHASSHICATHWQQRELGIGLCLQIYVHTSPRCPMECINIGLWCQSCNLSSGHNSFRAGFGHQNSNDLHAIRLHSPFVCYLVEDEDSGQPLAILLVQYWYKPELNPPSSDYRFLAFVRTAVPQLKDPLPLKTSGSSLHLPQNYYYWIHLTPMIT